MRHREAFQLIEKSAFSGTRKMRGNLKMGREETGWEDLDRILLVEDRDHWWAFVNPVMTHRVT
jgi:hypothetical protein